MKIYSVSDPKFKEFGKVLPGYDTRELLAAMEKLEMPESGTRYEPGIEALEACEIFKEMGERAFGDMPVQLGMCWGFNRKLNCLEYHRNSELNIGTGDYILLLAKQENIVDNQLDTSVVKAFRVPAGAVVEVYATSMHYAPCQVSDQGFRVAVVLPKNTNTDLEKPQIKNDEDKLLWARNKWLLAHPESDEASRGAFVGLTGENLTV